MNRLLFEKTGDAVYLSHLDLMRVFQRAFKRADILIWHSQGFSPRAYVSIALPLSVGVESRCEILDFDIEDGSADLTLLPEKLNRTMPAGIRVLKAYESGRKFKELTFLQTRVVLEYDKGLPENAEEAIRSLFEKEQILVMKHSKNGEKEVDIKPAIQKLEIRPLSSQELLLDCVVSAQNPGLNPQLLVQAITRYLPDCGPDFARISREEIFDSQMQIFR
ncbi:MAG: TIGR03936 family radical SAM-associated protein [Clostridia bacterium]|nr:TIGR03936 family radical SAM-associated protein [Clostridia bacterium]